MGLILAQELNMYEQNAVGNWFELIGQLLISNSSQLQLLNSKDEDINFDKETLNKIINVLKKEMDMMN